MSTPSQETHLKQCNGLGRVTRPHEVPRTVSYHRLEFVGDDATNPPTEIIRDMETKVEFSRVKHDHLNFYPGFHAVNLLVLEATSPL